VDLQLYNGGGAALYSYLLDQNNANRTLTFAEHWLRTHPSDVAVLRQYVETALENKATSRVDSYLETGLSVRPTRTEWHRAYQNLHEKSSDYRALLARYDALLASSPNDSSLLYLRGRIDADRTTTRDYFNRAAEADSKNPYPLFGLAYDRIMSGDWAAARPLAAKAAKLDPTDTYYEQILLATRLALGEASAIEQECRNQLKREPASVRQTIWLIESLATQKRSDELIPVCTTFDLAMAKYGDQGKAPSATIRNYALYAKGDFSALEKATKNNPPKEKTVFIQALIEQGRVDEAAKFLGNASDEDRLPEILTIAISRLHAGRQEEAARWLERARHILESGNEDYAKAAQYLGKQRDLKPSDIEDLVLPPQNKTIVLTAILAWNPEKKDLVIPLIRKLNVLHDFPYHFVDRTISAF
jgi:hypothetical protein